MGIIRYKVELRMLDNGKNFPYQCFSGAIEADKRLSDERTKKEIIRDLRNNDALFFDELLEHPDFVSLSVYEVEYYETISGASFKLTGPACQPQR